MGAEAGLKWGVQQSTDAMKAAIGNKYQGRMTPQTSDYTRRALGSMADVVGSMGPSYGKNALNAGDYLWNKVQSGGYDPQMYDPAAAIEAGARPIIERYTENLLPQFNSMLTASGGYQGTQPGGAGNIVGQQLSRDLTREVAQVAGEQSLAAADLNNRYRMTANDLINQTLGGLPAMYANGANAAMVAPNAMAGLGGFEESLAGRDITEALSRINYDNNFAASVISPYQQLLMDPASAFSTTTSTTKQKADPISQAIQFASVAAQIAMGMPPTAGGESATAPPRSLMPGGQQASYGGYGTPTNYSMNPTGAFNSQNAFSNPYSPYFGGP